MINNMASCWRMQMSNGKVLCFTDADIDIIYEGETYRCGGYFTPNNIISSNELAQDNFTISGIIDGEVITKQGLMAGDFADGYLEVFMIKGVTQEIPGLRHYVPMPGMTKVEETTAPSGKIILKTGWIGDIKISNNKFIASVNSLSSKTNNLIGKCYSPSCRAEFADQSCKISKENYSFSGKVTDLAEAYAFIDSLRTEPDDYFTQGILEFTSGSNKGKKYNIFMFQEGKITIDSAINQAIKIGDKYKITAGCNKSLYSCINKFSNAINFRGEPFIPNRHKLVARN